MKRFILGVLLAVAAVQACGGPYTYTAYEVIHQADLLHAGDNVRVVPLGGEPFQGQLVSVEDGQITVDTSGDRQRTIAWNDIRVIERVRRVTTD